MEEKDVGLDQFVICFRENEGNGELKAYYTSDVHVSPISED